MRQRVRQRVLKLLGDTVLAGLDEPRGIRDADANMALLLHFDYGVSNSHKEGVVFLGLQVLDLRCWRVCVVLHTNLVDFLEAFSSSHNEILNQLEETLVFLGVDALKDAPRKGLAHICNFDFKEFFESGVGLNKAEDVADTSRRRAEHADPVFEGLE